MKISIGADHAGFQLKEILKNKLIKLGHTVQDFGTHSENSVDYPDYALPVAESVAKSESDKGIVICGNGLGCSYVANKVPGVRAALVSNEILAQQSREHGDSNVLALGGRPETGGIEPEKAELILNIWLNTNFQGGRHQKRVDKIKEIDEKYRNK